jgi:chemotaxis protein CheX
MVARELLVLIRGLEYFLEQALSESAQIGVPYLTDARSKPGDGCTGVIEVSGRRRGRVYFTASRGLLSVLLMRRGEAELSQQNMSALVAEITNMISNNAHRELGGDFLTSVRPVTAEEPDLASGSPSTRLVLVPVYVRNHEAQLRIALQ